MPSAYARSAALAEQRSFGTEELAVRAVPLRRTSRISRLSSSTHAELSVEAYLKIPGTCIFGYGCSFSLLY